MKTRFKRLFSGLLTLCMASVVFSQSAFAINETFPPVPLPTGKTISTVSTTDFEQERQKLLEIVRQYGFEAKAWTTDSEGVYWLKAKYPNNRATINMHMHEDETEYLHVGYSNGQYSSGDWFASHATAVKWLSDIIEKYPVDLTALEYDFIGADTFDTILRPYAESIGYSNCSYSIYSGLHVMVFVYGEQKLVVMASPPDSEGGHYSYQTAPVTQTQYSTVLGTTIAYQVNDIKAALFSLTPAPPSSWAAASVNSAVAAGLVPEALQSKYSSAITRAEFCSLAVALYEAVMGEEISGRSSFSDTTDINVEKIASLGVVSGVGDNKFSPDASLTREQAATMLSRLATAIGKPLTEQAPTFADNGSISSWASGAVGQVQVTGIMGGVGNNTFAPKDSYTREQSIVTVLRLYEVVK